MFHLVLPRVRTTTGQEGVVVKYGIPFCEVYWGVSDCESVILPMQLVDVRKYLVNV